VDETGAIGATKRLEPLGKVCTKIVATVGPASRDPATLNDLVAAGVDLFRLNFSHGTTDEHTLALNAIRAIGKANGCPVGVLQDLSGPKIRLGPLPGGEIECRLGEFFTLLAGAGPAGPRQLTCTYPELVHDLKHGDVVLFADGAVAMRVKAVTASAATLEVTLPGPLRSGQGMNLPGVALKLPALTEKDLHDLNWTAASGVHYVCQSFVRRAADVAWLRRELVARGSRARIIAKIEKPEALDELDAIIAESDALMVARGDLGVELEIERVPAVQKRLIAACNHARIPVITATQMLSSMENSNRPTRAEATDVFNAVLDGTDAVMLSAETAIGNYPVDAVATMSRILTEAENFLRADAVRLWPQNERGDRGMPRGGWITPITESVVEAAGLVGMRLNAAIVVVATQSGRTALALSKLRQPVPTLAIAAEEHIARSIALYWGVTPLLFPALTDTERAFDFALDWARNQGLITAGDRVVLVSGTMPGKPTHNALLVQEV
jgi:pyruvate kinase